MLARNKYRLAQLEQELPGSKAFAFDLANLDHLVAVCRQVKEEMGLPDVIVHNAVRATFKGFLDAEPEELERNFRVNTTSLLYMARELAPAMVDRGSGATMTGFQTLEEDPVTNMDTIRRVYQCFDNRDYLDFKAMRAPDIEWMQNGGFRRPAKFAAGLIPNLGSEPTL